MKSLLFITLIWTSLSSYPIDFEKLFQKQSQQLLNLEIENPPLVLLFSGTPGMGKTTVTKELEKTFQGIRIGIDDTRVFFKEEGLTYELLTPYLFWLLNKVHEISPNRLLILDLICHPFHDELISWCLHHETPYFLTRLEVPREIVEARIVSRGNKPELTLSRLDRNWKEYEAFAETHTFDYILDNTEDNVSYAPLIQTLTPLIRP
ncbi:MAG: hypothetical protein KDK62_05060 [Chlamydiia bacterium]|nr:hypothetical protein [Chlamydiia bacterium]